MPTEQTGIKGEILCRPRNGSRTELLTIFDIRILPPSSKTIHVIVVLEGFDPKAVAYNPANNDFLAAAIHCFCQKRVHNPATVTIQKCSSL